MLVDFTRVSAVAKQFEEIIIGQEVEPREGSSLGLQQTVQHLLTFVKSLRDVIEVIVEVVDQQSHKDVGVVVDTVHVGTDPAVQNVEFVDVTDQLPILVLLGGEDCLQVNPLPLHLSQHFQGL